MITTGDHDDRVVPAHSFKFAAELQAKQAGDNPVLIRIDVKCRSRSWKIWLRLLFKKMWTCKYLHFTIWVLKN